MLNTTQNTNSHRTINQTAIAAKDATSYATPILNAKIAESYNTTSTPTTTDNQIKNGIWTITNEAKGTHRTFKIHTAKSGRFGQKRFVSLLVGSDNENCYEGFAFVENNSIRVWNAHRTNQNGSKSDFAKFAEILVDLMTNDGKKYGKLCTLKGSVNCLRCNRLLSVPSSIDNRYGSECAKKMLSF